MENSEDRHVGLKYGIEEESGRIIFPEPARKNFEEEERFEIKDEKLVEDSSSSASASVQETICNRPLATAGDFPLEFRGPNGNILCIEYDFFTAAKVSDLPKQPPTYEEVERHSSGMFFTSSRHSTNPILVGWSRVSESEGIYDCADSEDCEDDGDIMTIEDPYFEEVQA